MKNLRIAIFFFAGIIALLWLASCFQNDPVKTTDLVFHLDSSLVGKFDSVKVMIYADSSGKTPVDSATVKLSKGQTSVVVEKPSGIPNSFTVVVTGYTGTAISYQKQFSYANNSLDTTQAPTDLLRQLRDIQIANQTAKPGDTLRIPVSFVPANALDTDYVATSSDTSRAKILGHRIACLDTGTVSIHLVAGTAKISKAFNLVISKNIVLPDSVTGADTTMALFDSLAAVIAWTPSNTTERGYSFTALDTGIVKLSGNLLVAQALGKGRVVVQASADKALDTFTVTVRLPIFSDVKPITGQWCGQCHGANNNFNLQDSSTLLQKGILALYRMALSPDSSGYMPADKKVLTVRDGKMLAYWLLQYVTPLTGITVSDQSAKLGDTLRVPVAFIPADAQDTDYVATSSDTTRAKIVGHRIACLDTGTVSIHLLAGTAQISKSFNLSISRTIVLPDSVKSPDTTMVLFDTVTAGIVWTPGNTTERGYTLTGIDTSIVKVVGTRLVAQALGKGRVLLQASTGKALDTFNVTVRAPVFADVKPITKLWCGACHGPGVTFDLQDSATLVQKGSKALYRMSLPTDSTAYMPADKKVLPLRDKRMLIYWLQQNVKPVTAMDVKDTTLQLGDSSVPNVLWTPSDATIRTYSLVSSNTAKVGISGVAMIANDTGAANVQATSDDGGFKKTFKAAVVLPDFNTRIKPITTAKCGACHSPVRTFNLQDSTILVLHGTEALRRILLPVSDPAHMPADTTLTLSPRELKALTGWLNAYVVKLVGVTVDSLTLKLGETKPPVVHWNPANASNKGYTLAPVDTTKTRSPDGANLVGLAVGSTLVGLTTVEGNLSRFFTVTVVPVPMDSLRGVDTGGAIGADVIPRVLTYPANVTDSTWTLVSLTPTLATIQPGNKIRGVALGTAKIQITSTGTPAVKDTMDFAVGPVRVISVTVADQTVTIDSIFTPNITWNPAAATVKTYSVSSADTSIVRIYAPDAASLTPRLQAKGVGTVTLTLDALDADYVVQFHVTVGNVKATAIKLVVPTPFSVDSAYSPSATWTPLNTTIKTFTLSTNTPTLVTIPTPPATSFKGTLLGAAKIIATSADGPKDTESVTFIRPPYSKVSSIIATRCNSCHGPGLGLPTLDSLNATTAAAIYATSTTLRAEIVRRIQITPASAAGHMPGDGVTILPAAEMAAMIKYFSW